MIYCCILGSSSSAQLLSAHCHRPPYEFILLFTILSLHPVAEFHFRCTIFILASNTKAPRQYSHMMLRDRPGKYGRKRGIRTVTILDVQSKKSRSFFALVLKLEAECCVCSSAFILYSPCLLSEVQIKRKKKKKKRKKIQSSPRDLSPLRL